MEMDYVIKYVGSQCGGIHPKRQLLFSADTTREAMEELAG